ncbi:PEP-CTERM sorting domain-containing protein [Marinobacter sp. X15-166B]|uniref:PEP-CTERM sorting domain-containing protein n=1 Tax=Marinobacter sp. X15-166B TaxID=1897620 RepID=UPI0013016397|nr:PEP-CTERM sorting domain-containing protein [Marinobacter sp. X15-166B]
MRQHHPLPRIVLTTCLTLLLALPAAASLIGDEVEIQWYFPDQASPVPPHFGPFTVEAGPADAQLEPAQDITLDVEAASLHIFFDPANGPIQWLDAAFNGPVFMDLDWLGMPGAVISGVDVMATVTGFTADRVTFSDHSVAVNFANLIHTGGEVNIELVHSVPEPATLWLLSLAICAVVLRARHRTPPD